MTPPPSDPLWEPILVGLLFIALTFAVIAIGVAGAWAIRLFC